MRHCIIRTCRAPSSSGDSKVILHVFPPSIDQIKVWLQSTRHPFRDIDAFAERIKEGKIYDTFRICSAHFKPEDYKGPVNRRKLKRGAFPSIFQHVEGVPLINEEMNVRPGQRRFLDASTQTELTDIRCLSHATLSSLPAPGLHGIHPQVLRETEIKEEALAMEDSSHTEVSRDLCKDIKLEYASILITPERPLCGEYGDTSAVQCKEEECSPVIGAEIKEEEHVMEDSDHVAVSRDLHKDIKVERPPERSAAAAEETRATHYSSASILPGPAPEEPSAGQASLVLKMEKDWSHTTEKIWSLTLEIVCLLTGETFPLMSSDHVTMAVSPPASWTLERITMQKILEISYKITELLFGEVPMRYQHVAAALSMEKQKCLEECKEIYMDIKMEEQHLPIQRSLHPLYSQDSMQEGHLTPHHYQAGAEKAELVVEACGDTGVGNEVELSSHPVAPERPLLGHGYAKRGMITLPISSDFIVEDEEKIYSCSECGKSFSRKTTLDEHERIHTGEKPYSCSKCGIRFSQKSILIDHAKFHTGKKPYSCFECGKCYSRKSELEDHETVHTGEKPFSCPECGKRFYHKSHLVSHQRVHYGAKPYSCTECGERFSRKLEFIKHERCHTGKKIHSCSGCGSCFSQKSDLTNLEISHTGEKPYSCSVCGECFFQKSSLISHKITHTEETGATVSL